MTLSVAPSYKAREDQVSASTAGCLAGQVAVHGGEPRLRLGVAREPAPLKARPRSVEHASGQSSNDVVLVEPRQFGCGLQVARQVDGEQVGGDFLPPVEGAAQAEERNGGAPRARKNGGEGKS